MIEMHVHARHDMSLEIVLDVDELPSEVPHMMVVDERDRRHRLMVRLTTPFLTHELITDEIAKRFRTCEVFPTPEMLSKSSRRWWSNDTPKRTSFFMTAMLRL